MDKNLSLTKEQNQVLEAKGKDILVAASAGSGKTFVVVERILNRIVNDYIDIDKILVVTFTNAAASELRERILNKFYDVLNDKHVEEEKKKHVEKQIKLINRAQISTIHSFCLNVIKNNFYLLNIDPNVKTLDESKAKIMLLESIDEVIENEYEKKTEDFIRLLDFFKSEDNLIEYIEKMYNFARSMVNPNEWLDSALNKYSLVNDNISDLIETDFGKEIVYSVKEKAEILQRELEIVCDKIRGDSDFESRLALLDNMLEKIEELKMLDKYDSMYNFLQSQINFPRLPSSKCVNEDLKKEVADIKKKAVAELDNMSKMVYMDTAGILKELQSMYNSISCLVNYVKAVDKGYTDKKKANSQIDFNDYEHLALKVLQNEDIAKQYKEKFEEIYIDEYQDTSYIQEVLLKAISKNNRIMVGDVKQSIYSFRNAEPKLFNEKYNSYLSYEEKGSNSIGNKIILSQNFRSRKCVLDSINDIFKRIMSENIGECDYSETEYLRYGNGFDNNTEQENITEINIVETDYEEDSEDNAILDELEEISNTEKEAYVIAEDINKMIKEGKKVYNLKEKEYRNVEYKDIVILLRSTSSKASIYEEVLKANGIPAYSDTSDSFYNSEEVGIILSLFKAIDNIYDDISLISIMYSIIGKFTLDDLVYIRKYDKRGYLYNALTKAYADKENISEELYLKLKTLIEFMEKVRIYLNTYTIAETILKIYEETGIYYSFYLEEMGKQKCANLDSLVEIAKNFEKEEKSSIYQFINYIESMKTRKTKGGDSPKLIGEGENVVRILTIHKSKGLEYPIVLVADTSKKYNIMDTSDEIIFDKELGIGSDIYNMKLGISYPSVIKQAIKGKIKNRTVSEEERLLYVAMTRAKEKLCIYGTVKNYEKMKSKALMFNGVDRISPIIVKDANSYLKLLLLAINYECADTFKVNIRHVDREVELNKSGNNGEIVRSISPKESFLKLCSSKNLETQNIDLEFEKKYDYLGSTNVKKKYSATELKQMDKEEQNIEELLTNKEVGHLSELKPSSISSNLTSMGYGTLVHKILEEIDYANVKEEEINRLIEDKLSLEKNINLEYVKNKILKYLNSDIKSYIANAKSIRKELPFVIYDDLKDFTDITLDERTYIQGVIDLFIVTSNGENVIIDFKTDSVENKDELIKKYKTQLNIYKKGIELSLKEKVSDMYIYSFHLDKLIKV